MLDETRINNPYILLVFNISIHHLSLWSDSGLFYLIRIDNLTNLLFASALSRGEEVELKFTGLKKWENYKLFFSKSGRQFELDENSKITIPINE